MKTCLLFFISYTSLFAVFATKKPNIVLILTDDQDLLLGSMTPVKQVQKMIANHGATFKNAFVSTPICCPSRSSILTGLYMHNHGTVNNSLSGGCSSPSWHADHESRTFGAILSAAGYRTFYGGKYLNAYGSKKAGGTQHVPKGWDWWIGLVGNSRYYNYTLSINGTARFFGDKYLTNVIQNYSLEFLDVMQDSPDSFLMVLATPACHAPFIPEPRYSGKYEGIKVPRTPNFNTHQLKNRHWLLTMEPAPLPNDTVVTLDSYHARRWETLLSVDNMVAATVEKLRQINQLDNTYILFTSDHGYHLGQFGLPWDKRQPYETDIRVPFLIRGPGIRPKSLVEAVAVNIDIAPTILDMAGLPAPARMDGKSLLRSLDSSADRTFFLEYSGEGAASTVSSECPLVNDNTLSECYPLSSCKCQDSRNNTYNCIRRLNPTENTLYCEFYKETGDLREYYDLRHDPYQIDNMYLDLTSSQQAQLQQSLNLFKACSGLSCQH